MHQFVLVVFREQGVVAAKEVLEQFVFAPTLLQDAVVQLATRGEDAAVLLRGCLESVGLLGGQGREVALVDE